MPARGIASIDSGVFEVAPSAGRTERGHHPLRAPRMLLATVIARRFAELPQFPAARAPSRNGPHPKRYPCC